MSDLTENEVFSRMNDSLLSAANLCVALAKSPVRGANYRKFREELKLIEGCARQISAMREDTRWLPIGLQMGEVHKRAGGWLRGAKKPDGTKVLLSEGQLQPLFLKLGMYLLDLLERFVPALRHKRPPKLGMILPDSTRVSPGGIILP